MAHIHKWGVMYHGEKGVFAVCLTDYEAGNVPVVTIEDLVTGNMPPQADYCKAEMSREEIEAVLNKHCGESNRKD